MQSLLCLLIDGLGAFRQTLNPMKIENCCVQHRNHKTIKSVIHPKNEVKFRSAEGESKGVNPADLIDTDGVLIYLRSIFEWIFSTSFIAGCNAA